MSLEAAASELGIRAPRAVGKRHNAGAEGLADGSMRQCTSCEELKPKEAFYDPKLMGGKGNHGRKCMACKAGS
jgi:hypothetical protein